MTQTSCPSCGAALTFQASHSLIAVCAFCQSTVLRKDLDLSIIGKMSEVREDHSPLQIGAAGSYQGTPFKVVGRLQVAYDGGAWNEWRILLVDGREGWLGESNGRISVLFEEHPDRTLPDYGDISLGQQVTLSAGPYRVTDRRRAKVVGAQGELPSQLLGGFVLPFVDLTSEGGRFATLDYSDGPKPLVFSGQFVRLRDLAMTGLRQFERFAAGVKGANGDVVDIEAESFSCPSCAAPVTISVPGQSRRYGCTGCGALLSVGDENVDLIERWHETVDLPDIPIGSRGILDGVTWEVLGVVNKVTRDEYFAYRWREHLLFNPYEGYRWLVQNDGHFSFLETCLGTPSDDGLTGKKFKGVSYREFQKDAAQVEHVLGEFYWQVRLGDIVSTADYIDPPRMLSMEATQYEEVWTQGTYRPGQEIWEAFELPGSPPVPQGVAPNQPFDPTGRYAGFGKSFALLALVLLLGSALQWVTSKNEIVAHVSGVVRPTDVAADAVAWSEPFEVSGRAAAVAVRSQAQLNNQWLYLDMALVEEATGEIYPIGHGLEYWSGPGWSEGNLKKSSTLGPVKAGRWVLRVAPQYEPKTAASLASNAMSYDVQVKWDVPRAGPPIFALIILALGPAIVLVRKLIFENKRWNSE